MSSRSFAAFAGFILLLAGGSSRAAEWRAGTEGTIKTPNLPRPARVFLPENWMPGQKWPAILFYPWTGGQADTAMMRAHTNGRDFIIVGMPPRQDGAFTYSPEIIKLEQLTLHEVRDQLATDVQLDPARIYVAGFSKGGWLSALLLAHEPGLAGGCVLGGGWSHHQHARPQKFRRPVFVYVGAGRLDGNFAPSLRASREFEALGAGVVFDAWPDTGHELPTGGAEGMRQWLALAARGNALRTDAQQWMETEFARIAAITDPIERWDAFRRLATFPFTRMLGAEPGKRIDSAIAELMKNPAVAAEAALDRELSAIHLREIQDMRVTTLEAVGPRYEALAQRAPGTRTGKLAAHDAGRIKKLWETVPR